MKTYRNTRFTKRDYETSNVVACQGEAPPAGPWVECDASILKGLDALWIVAGVRFFGYL